MQALTRLPAFKCRFRLPFTRSHFSRPSPILSTVDLLCPRTYADIDPEILRLEIEARKLELTPKMVVAAGRLGAPETIHYMLRSHESRLHHDLLMAACCQNQLNVIQYLIEELKITPTPQMLRCVRLLNRTAITDYLTRHCQLS